MKGFIMTCLMFISMAVYGQWTVPAVMTNIINVEDMHFTTATTGYAVGTNQFPNGNAVIVKTSDGGNSWSIVFNLPPSTIPSFLSFNDINFVTNSVAYAVGGYPDPLKAVICKTIDGGSTWDTLPHNITTSRVSHTYFFSPNVGFCTANEIHKTTDGGLTWTVVNSPLGSNGVTDIHFISADTGYAIGSLDNLLIQSVDGGLTWNPISLPTTEDTRVLFFVNNKTGFIGCDNGVILKTTDGGNTWSQTVNNDTALEDITAIDFASASVGFVGTTAGIILKTSNAGDTWDVNYDIKTSPVIPFAGIRSLAFANANVGYAGTSFTFIAKTTNAGGTIIIPTSVEEFNPLDQILFYPNPSFGQVNINLKQDTQGHLQIFNWNGEIVYSADIDQQYQTIDLPLSVASGIYLVNLITDDNTYSEKLIVNRD